MMRFVLISLAFNAFWLAAALGQSAAVPYLALALIVAVFVDRQVLLACGFITVLGLSGDILLVHNGWLSFSAWPFPLWFVLLWAGFGAYVWLIRGWLVAKPTPVLLLAGSIGGALSYLAGDRLEALTFPQPVVATLVVVALAWLLYSAAILLVLNQCGKKEALWPFKQSVIKSGSHSER